jgi:hypothetical protein
VPAASRNNPISLRIYKAIGTNFDDRASREALEIASSFYSSKGKGKATVAADADDAGSPSDPDDLVPARRTLRGQSAAMARKHLKRDVEARLAGGSQRFLEAFGEVDKVRKLESPLLLKAYIAETRRAPRTHARDAVTVRPGAGRAGPGEQRHKVSP